MGENEFIHQTDPKSLKEVGKRIRISRTIKNMTQAQLSESLHVTPQAVSGWERGANSINTDILPCLAENLDVTIDYLLCGTGRFSLFKESNDNLHYSYPASLVSFIRNDQDYISYCQNIRERTKDACEDTRKSVEKAFETFEPLHDIMRLLICSYCNCKRLEPDSFPFSHVLAIIPFLRNQNEIDSFAGLLDLDPDIYMMYALAPYVSQELLGYWAGLCDFRHDAPFAARLMPLLSEDDKLLYMERIVYEMPSPDIAKFFSDYLTPEVVSQILTCRIPINAALSLFGKLDTQQIRDLIMRCSPEEIPNLAYCVPHEVPDEIIQLLFCRCSQEKKSKLSELMFGLENELVKKEGVTL